jgi:flagellar biosynthesis protein FliR
VKLILVPFVDPIYSRISLKSFLVIYNEVVTLVGLVVNVLASGLRFVGSSLAEDNGFSRAIKMCIYAYAALIYIHNLLKYFRISS